MKETEQKRVDRICRYLSKYCKKNNSNMLKAASYFRNAIEYVLSNPHTRTIDIGGTLGTAEYGKLVVDAIRNLQ